MSSGSFEDRPWLDGITSGHPNHLLVIAHAGICVWAVITGVRDEKGSATPLG